MRGLSTPAAILSAAGLIGALAVPPRLGAQAGVAYLSLDLATGAITSVENRARVETAVLPGSFMKIVTLAAALESGAISERTAVACGRQVTIAGHTLTCTHPEFHRPIRAAEALAHSCNVFAATVARRLTRAALDRTLIDLGMPPSDPGTPMAAVSTGLEGLAVTPARLIEAVARIARTPSALPWRESTLAVIREGLREAARTGTASALAARGVDALAKTGTTVEGGQAMGLVAGVTPSHNPTRGFAVVVAGGSGRDAAALAAQQLVRAADAPEATLRIGLPNRQGEYTVRSYVLDEYVAGVVAGEAPPAAGRAALEALAVTVRTYALANRGRHAVEGFDLCTLTHCQVLRPSTASTRAAAAATAGAVLLHDGVPAPVFFTASCGGRTERPSRVWPGAADPPFLPSRVDDACNGQPAWQSELDARDLMRALRVAGFQGDLLRGVRVIDRTPSGRVARLALDGFVPPEISGESFRLAVGRGLGWQHLKSASFEIAPSSTGFRFTGRGAGHGVGLCVLGAAARASRGESSGEILSHYFPRGKRRDRAGRHAAR